MNQKRCSLTMLFLTLLSWTIGGLSSAQTPSRSRSSSPSSAAAVATNADWNQFRGPQRDGICNETGLADAWPAGGPRLVQTLTGLGEGYGTVSFSGNMMYVMGNVDGGEHVIAMDRHSGDIRWKTRNGDEYRENMGNGPRGTPTVVAGSVYSLGAKGDLSCLKADSGEVVWQGNLLQVFGGNNITWGISESVLVDDGKVICTPGGSEASVVALDAKTGRAIWKSQLPEQPAASYASPMPMTIGRLKQYVVFTSKGICGIRANDGEPLWSQNASSNGTANCATPLVSDRYVFSSSDYGTGAELIELKTNSRGIQANQVYFTKDMKNHHGGMVLWDGHVYGSNGDMLSCMDWMTGQSTWRQRSMKGSVLLVDGKIIFRHEDGPVTMLAVDSTEYRELSKFDQPDRSNRPAWAYPVVADGQLYLRDQDKLFVYDLR